MIEIRFDAVPVQNTKYVHLSRRPSHTSDQLPYVVYQRDHVTFFLTHAERNDARALCTLVHMLLTVCKLQHSPLTLNKLGYLANTHDNVELLDGKISMGDWRRLTPW